MTDFRATQIGVEVWARFTSQVVVDQLGLETWTRSVGVVATDQLGVETWIKTHGTVSIYQLGYELWRSTSTVGTQMTTSQLGCEYWLFYDYVAPVTVGSVIVIMGG